MPDNRWSYADLSDTIDNAIDLFVILTDFERITID